jgi:GTP cyclohydrolase I
MMRDDLEYLAMCAYVRHIENDESLRVASGHVGYRTNNTLKQKKIHERAKEMTQESPEHEPAEYYYKKFMEAIGQDPTDSEHLEETPRRVTEAFRDDFFSGCDEDPRRHLSTTFGDTESGDNSEGIVIVDNIQVQSVCAHHFLPFTGVAHVGYIPEDEVVGLSKFARLVKGYARRPQVQERLTNQVADAINDELEPQAVFVTILADHQCMSCRGVMEPYSTTRTSAIRGEKADELESKFYAMLDLETNE